MSLSPKIVTIFGATGFVGRHIVQQLAAQGMIIKVATRIPESAYCLKPYGAVGQIVPVACQYKKEDSVARAIKGSHYVINCIGILYEKRKRQSFQRLHTELPEVIAKACKTANIGRLIHISALGCNSGSSKYAKSKYAGEHNIFKHFENATILRPSIIFGEDDNFFNLFAKMSVLSPALPLIGGGKTLFQPIYVGDVANSVAAALANKATQGQTYQLGGPEQKTFRELIEIMFTYTQRPRALVSLPFFVAKIQATFLSLLPTPLLTRDQVESLKSDNIVEKDALTIEDLGITPTTMDLILPHYLERYRSGGRFGDKKYA